MTTKNPQGRKPISIEEPSITKTVRMTRSHLKKFQSLGGAKWLRSLLDNPQDSKACVLLTGVEK